MSDLKHALEDARAEIARGVDHAHQQGVIHRDLKPSNILVTEVDGQAVPKVIDFGVAKALGQQLTEKTLFTAFQQMIGTPAYMSPEQTALSGADVDTRSDVYSLAATLYYSLAKYLAVGLLIAAFISALIPDGFFHEYLGDGFLGGETLGEQAPWQLAVAVLVLLIRRGCERAREASRPNAGSAIQGDKL